MDIETIIFELERYDGTYKREQVTYALEHKEEITPYLLSILKNVAADPLTFIQNENYFGHVYALILLGFFKEVKAHKLIINLFSIPEQLIEELFGDIAYENLQEALYQTCGGSLESIKQMVLNKNISDSTRNSAISALLYAVVDDIASREEVLTFLSSLFTGNETEKPSDFWSYVACDICDLCPDTHSYEVIKKAYSDGLIEDGIVGLEEFQEAIDLGVEKSLDHIRQDKLIRLPDDFHDMMSWWACFVENNKTSVPTASNPSQKKSKRAKKKSKRKIQKKSRLNVKKKKKRKK